MPDSTVTLSTQTIHNPAEPRHFMRLMPVSRRVRIKRGAEILAETTDAIRVVEIGRDVYEPALYIPEADVSARLRRTEKSTHCPLKGDAAYFDLLDEAGAVVRSEIAWSYPEPFDFAPGLKGRVAFYLDELTVEEGPR